jgi:hypothetical protein
VLHAGGNLLEQLQPFSTCGELEQREAGDVAAGAREAGNETCAHRIGALNEYDRYVTRGLLQRLQGGSSTGDQDVGRHGYQLGRMATALSRICSPSKLNSDIEPYIPPELLQSLQKCSNARLPFRIVR